MKYVRVNVNNSNIDSLIDTYGLFKESEYEYSDYIYLNKNGSDINNDVLKLRIYKQNGGVSSDAIVIRKETTFEDGLKDDETIFRKEIDTRDEAVEYVNENFSDYEFKFKILKKGTLYTSDDLSVSYEDIDGIGKSIEIGGYDSNLIEEVIDSLDVNERLTTSLPEYAYKKFVSKVN